MDYSFMLDPSEEGFYYALLDDATLHKTGRTATVAGREVLETRIGTISWGLPAIHLPGLQRLDAPDIVAILKVDGALRYASPAVERILGYRPEELLGTSAFDYVHPDDRAFVEGEFARSEVETPEQLEQTAW